MATLEQTQGCLLGLSLGDALGAPYEGGILEQCLWRMIGSTRQGEIRWTDDTQMSIDVIESYLATGRIDSDDLATRFAKSYRWSRGYGPGAAKLLKRIAAGANWRDANRSIYPNGSFGNGAAMRAPMIGLIYASRPTELPTAARESALVTHAHPLGIDGAVLIAQATAHAWRGLVGAEILDRLLAESFGDELASRLAIAQKWLASSDEVCHTDVVGQLGNGVAAHKSCVTALYLALRFHDQSFIQMQTFIASCGGDVDTIGAMARAMWGVINGYGQLPAGSLARLEQHERLLDLAATLYQRLAQSATSLPDRPA